MKKPLVSVCVPNLNTRPFLPERFESIFQQTVQDWELIVYDSYSDDGAWEYVQELGKREPRMRISQGPREGIYPGWNNCVRQTRGEYVYIATSDDTMAPDCLEKLMNALEERPDCDIAHCCLKFIDQDGNPISGRHCWENWCTTRYFGDWNNKYHIRPAGHDTVLALALDTVYYSITQILIRRSLFDKVGEFQNVWGSFGDLEWQMRATLATATVHVPEYLATWRVHPQQATQSDRHLHAKLDWNYVAMADSVIEFSKRRGLPFRGGLPGRLRRFRWNEYLEAHNFQPISRSTRFRLFLGTLKSDYREVVRYYWGRLKLRFVQPNESLFDQVRAELRRLDIAGPKTTTIRGGVSSVNGLAD